MNFCTLAAMSKVSVAVVGAGAFGGWTAVQLLRRGARVQLVDAWGPGNSRASSGGGTRITRATYGGPGQPYTKMSHRALRFWYEFQRLSGQKLLHRTGVLWMARAGSDAFERESLAALTDAEVPFQQLSRAELDFRWPQVNFS